MGTPRNRAGILPETRSLQPIPLAEHRAQHDVDAGGKRTDLGTDVPVDYIQIKTLPEFGDPQAIAWVNEEKKSGSVACHTLAPPSSHIDDGWCVRSCAKDYCPKDICSNECRASSGANATDQQQEELERQQRQQHRQQEQERERLSQNSRQCHSIASPESGIEDGWCIDTCSQGSCSAEFCSLEHVRGRT